MFDFLKGGKYRLTLDLDRQTRTYYPGENITVNGVLEARKGMDTQGGSITLVRRERIQAKRFEQSYDSEAMGQTTERTGWEQVEHVVSHVEFLAPGVIEGVRNFTVQIDIPEQTIPSFQGKLIEVEWLLKTVVDRKMHPDLNDEQGVDFRLPSYPYQIQQAAGLSSRPNDINLSIQLQDKSWDFYRPLTGNLLILPLNDFDVKGFRVDLVRVERVPGAKENSTNVTFQGVKQEGAQLKEGISAVVPFQVEMPQPGMTSLDTGSWSVSWLLQATLFRSWRKDIILVDELVIG